MCVIVAYFKQSSNKHELILVLSSVLLSRTTIIFIRKHCRSNRHMGGCADRLGDVLYVVDRACVLESQTRTLLTIFSTRSYARARLRYRRRVRLSHDRSESKLMNRASGFRIIFFPFFTRRSAALTLNVTLNLFLAEHLHSCHRHYYDGVIVVTQKCGVLKVSSSNLYLKCDKRT